MHGSSTGSLSARDRYEAWRNLLSAVFEPLLPEGHDRDDLAAEARATHFGSIMLSDTNAEAQHFSRTQRLIAAAAWTITCSRFIAARLPGHLRFGTEDGAARRHQSRRSRAAIPHLQYRLQQHKPGGAAPRAGAVARPPRQLARDGAARRVPGRFSVACAYGGAIGRRPFLMRGKAWHLPPARSA